MTVLAGSATRAATDTKEAAEILPRIGAVHTIQVLRQDQLDLMDITAREPPPSQRASGDTVRIGYIELTMGESNWVAIPHPSRRCLPFEVIYLP